MMKTPKGQLFDPRVDMPSLAEKVILITGGTSGLGKQAALDLARQGPAEIWITGRSEVKGLPVIASINNVSKDTKVRFLEIDLGSLESVEEAAAKFQAAAGRLDILLLNAGIMDVPPALTKDGYEVQFGTNHLGHALLLRLLTPTLLQTASKSTPLDVRAVIVSSDGHKHSVPGGIQFDLLKSPAAALTSITRYGQSKLANVIYAREIAKRYPQWTTVALHPGTVKTEIHQAGGESMVLRVYRKLVLPLVGVPVETGVINHLWAATGTGVVSGEYYEPVGVGAKQHALASDAVLGSKLWDWTENELKLVSGKDF